VDTRLAGLKVGREPPGNRCARTVKIIIVHNEYKFGGGEDVVVRQEISLLNSAGHCVLPYIRNNRELENRGVLGRLMIAPKAAWAWDTKRDFDRLLKQEKPDVVHVHNTLTMISPAVYWSCAEAHVPVVQTLHNFRLFCPAGTYYRNGHICEECRTANLTRSVRYACYRNSRPTTAVVAGTLAIHRGVGTWHGKINTYIAFHQFAKRKCIEGGLPAEKISIKPNFVTPDPGAGSGPTSGKGEYAIFVGRLTPEKGIGTLLKAWELLKIRVPLVIIGEGPLALMVAEAVARIPVVDYKGRLPREQVVQAMKAARFLIFPSEWYEGFPVTIAEAFACGLPVIASGLGAMEELIEDGRTGLHFRFGDPADLAEKTTWAWSHPERTIAMSREARNEFLTRYTAEKNYPMLMEIYERAIGKCA
jgi:glycosyltransferase involved in cell wall biosynthesis